MEALTSEQLNFFKENGYLLIPGVLNKDEVDLLRKKILSIFRSGEWKKSPFNTEKVLSEVYDTFPEFIPITLTPKVVAAAKSILGDNPVLMPETSVHYKFYTGWHKDTTSQEKIGEDFHWKDEALMIQVGFYLQDNDEYGGGLTVMQGSHKTDDVFLEEYEPSLAQKVMDKISVPSQERLDKRRNPHGHPIVNIPSKAGDLVIFNFLTNHRASYPTRCSVEEIPEAKEKLAFFNAFSIHNSTAKRYLEFIKGRPEPFYQNLNRRVPNPELVKTVAKLGITAY